MLAGMSLDGRAVEGRKLFVHPYESEIRIEKTKAERKLRVQGFEFSQLVAEDPRLLRDSLV